MKHLKKIFIILTLINMNTMLAQKTVKHYPKASQNITIKNIDIVEFRNGDNFELIINGDERNFKYITTNDDLNFNIIYKGKNKPNNIKVVIIKPFNNNSKFVLNNIGTIKSYENLKFTNLYLDMNNVGIFKLNLDSENTILKGNNLSNFEIIGQTTNLNMDFGIVSILNLKDFIADNIVINIDIGSIMTLHAKNKIEGNIKTYSSLEIFGDPYYKLNKTIY